MKFIEKIKGKIMPEKKQKKVSKNETNQYPRWLKVLHVICYILSLIFIIVILYSCCNPVKNDNNNKVVPNNMYQLKETHPINKATQNYVDNLTNTYWLLDEVIVYDPVYYPNSYNQFSVTFGAFKSTTLYYVSIQISENQINIFDYDDSWEIYNGNSSTPWYYGVESRYLYLSGGRDINDITLKNWLNHYGVQCDSSWNVINESIGGGGSSSESPSSSEILSSEIPSSDIISSEDDSIIIPPFISVDESNLIEPLHAVINSNPRFVELFSNYVGTERIPNLYYNRNLDSVYQEMYYLDGMIFMIEGETDIYNTIIVKFGRLNANMFGTNPDTYTPLCFLNEGVIYDSNYSDFTSFQGCTANVGLLGINTSQYSNYYYVDKVYYANVPDTPDSFEMKLVFDGVRTTSATLYVADSGSGTPANLVSSGVTGTGTYFVRNGWINQNYRKILVLSNNGDLLNTPNSGLNNTDLLTFLTSNGGSSSVSGADINNVFTLLSLAFSSFVGLFSISLLPNLTLGILLFIPLVVIITLTIIRLIKRG